MFFGLGFGVCQVGLNLEYSPTPANEFHALGLAANPTQPNTPTRSNRFLFFFSFSFFRHLITLKKYKVFIIFCSRVYSDLVSYLCPQQPSTSEP